VQTQGGPTETTEEFYLRNAMGQELGIVDLTKDGWHWYSSGRKRLARIIPFPDQQPISQTAPNTATYPNFDYMANLTLTNIQYYVNDHLGNTRLVYEPSVTCKIASNPELIEYYAFAVYDYYPYGKVLRKFEEGQERYLSTQHERDRVTGLDYRGARYYDSDLGRFLSLDPLAADFTSWSPYNFVLANPISFVDHDGKAPQTPNRVVKTTTYNGHTFKVTFVFDANGRTDWAHVSTSVTEGRGRNESRKEYSATFEGGETPYFHPVTTAYDYDATTKNLVNVTEQGKSYMADLIGTDGQSILVVNVVSQVLDENSDITGIVIGNDVIDDDEPVYSDKDKTQVFNDDTNGDAVVDRVDFTLWRGQKVKGALFGSNHSNVSTISAYDDASNNYGDSFPHAKKKQNPAGASVIFERTQRAVPSFR
jgi:RHS repeat-associated protein